MNINVSKININTKNSLKSIFFVVEISTILKTLTSNSYKKKKCKIIISIFLNKKTVPKLIFTFFES